MFFSIGFGQLSLEAAKEMVMMKQSVMTLMKSERNFSKVETEVPKSTPWLPSTLYPNFSRFIAFYQEESEVSIEVIRFLAPR